MKVVVKRHWNRCFANTKKGLLFLTDPVNFLWQFIMVIYFLNSCSNYILYFFFLLCIVFLFSLSQYIDSYYLQQNVLINWVLRCSSQSFKVDGLIALTVFEFPLSLTSRMLQKHPRTESCRLCSTLNLEVVSFSVLFCRFFSYINHWKLWQKHEIQRDLCEIRDAPCKWLEQNQNTSK